METTMKASTPTPKWLQWFLDLRWDAWLGWITEAVLVVTFVVITYDQFAEGLTRSGWLMILLTVLFCGPGLWLLLGYKPQIGSKFGKYDVGAIICFTIWVSLLLYFLAWNVDFQTGLGHRFDISMTR